MVRGSQAAARRTPVRPGSAILRDRVFERNWSVSQNDLLIQPRSGLNFRDSCFSLKSPFGYISVYGVFYQVPFQDLRKNCQCQEVTRFAHDIETFRLPQPIDLLRWNHSARQISPATELHAQADHLAHQCVQTDCPSAYTTGTQVYESSSQKNVCIRQFSHWVIWYGTSGTTTREVLAMWTC